VTQRNTDTIHSVPPRRRRRHRASAGASAAGTAPPPPPAAVFDLDNPVVAAARPGDTLAAPVRVACLDFQ